MRSFSWALAGVGVATVILGFLIKYSLGLALIKSGLLMLFVVMIIVGIWLQTRTKN